MTLFNKALVIYKPVDICLDLANNASTTLRTSGIEVNTLTVDDISISRSIIRDKLLNTDLVVCVGGDGTFMRSAKVFTSSLILPYPCGRRNVYYERSLPDIRETIKQVLKGDFHIEFIPLYQVCYESTCTFFVNDAVVISTDLGKASKYFIKLQSHLTNDIVVFEGDGFILSSTHGSSGHNLSAKGPLVLPVLEAITLTMLNPMQVGATSIVIPAPFSIEAWSKNRTQLYIDGDFYATIKENSVIKVEHGLNYAKVIRFNPARNTWRSVLEPRKCIFW
ncbi:MAG: hypothetical protein QXV54_05735 [Desulfurococcaceae archaeon]